jgi:hypothetical protein
MMYWYMIYTDRCQTCGHITTYRVRMYGNHPLHNDLKYKTREVWCDKHKGKERMFKLYAQH